MRAIQRQMPNPKHVEIHRIAVTAPPDAAWQAARHFDGASIPWVRLLFDLRAIPAKIMGRTVPPEEDRRLGVDQVADSGKGFMIVEERPGREVVVGAAGQFWHVEIPFANVTPAAFARFDAAGWGKLTWAISVDPYGAGSLVTFELRTTATDEESWRRLSRYFHVIGAASHLIRSSVMSHLEARLGKMAPPDRARPLAGDSLVADAGFSLTHSVDIEAPPVLVWPWLMQLGCDRGGWYSVDLLDHGGKPSTEHLVPEWTKRSVGDRVAATPAKDSFYDVLVVEPESAYVIGGETNRLGGSVKMSWAFALEPLGDDATRLVTRVRAHAVPRWSEWLQGAVVPPVHALMQHVQLDTLKRLAEREAQARRG